MADLFQEYGIEYKPKDLFAEFNIEPPTAAQTNSSLGNNFIDINKYKETSRLYDLKLQELKSKKEEKSLTNMIADFSMDENGEVEFEWYNPLSWVGSSVAKNRKYLDDQIATLEKYEDLIKSSMTPERFKEIKDFGAIGIYESAKRNLKWENTPIVGGFVEGYKKGKISDIMEKIRDEKDLTDEENSIAQDYINDQIEIAIRGTSFGGKIVDGVSRMPAFMVEYGLAKGMFGKFSGAVAKTSIGQKATSAAGKVASKISSTGKIGSVSVKASKAVGVAAGRAMFMPATVYNNYNDIRLNNLYSLSENGQVLFNEDPENKAIMTLKAFGLTSITALAENSGEAITDLVKRGVSPIFNRLPASVRNGIVKLARETEKYKDTPISVMFSKGGYSNILGEIGEERLEDLLGAVTGLNPQGDTYFDSIGNALLPEWEQFMVEAGVISIAGGARSGLNYLYKKGYTPKFLKGLSTKEQDQLVEKELQKDSGKVMKAPEVQEIPLDQIFLSPDIPNFKEGANENGVVAGEQLQGTYDRIGTPPIVLWERRNGRIEIITGRHRFDLAKRSGETTIPAQILKESDGFTAEMARMLDVEQNIKDEKGSIRDYARYFKHNNITQEEAFRRGLLGRAKGRSAFSIAKNGTDSLYAGFVNGGISETKATAIADGAPNNEAAQAAGIKAAKKLTPEELQAYVSVLSLEKPKENSSGDLFGFDDSAVKEAEEIAKLVAKDKKEINNKIRAVKGASNNPKAAEEMGLRFAITPENIGKEIERLEEDIQKLDHFYSSPELMQHYRSLLKGEETRSRDEILADMVLFDNPSDVFSPYKDEESPKNRQQTNANQAETSPVDINNDESWVENWNRHLFDTVAPLQKISDLASEDLKAGERPDLLARSYQYSRMMIEKNITDKTYYIDENGNEVDTGEGFVPILNDFTSTFAMVEPRKNAALDDFNDYLVSIRYIEDLDELEGVEVTEQQKIEALSSIAKLQEKYGENFNLFEDFANRIYGYQQRILHNLVDSGNLSEEQYNDIIEKHKHYVPFKRVLEEKNVSGGISGRPIFDEARTSKAIKRIRGSEKAVKNVFVSIEMNAANIIDLAYRNKIARSVARLRSILPEYIKEKKPLYEKGTAKIKVAYDPRLRQQLEEAIRLLGGRIEYKKSLGRGVLGSFSPDEQIIRKRLGAQDRTLAHEFGHMIDFMFDTVKALSNPELKKEINKLAEERFYTVIKIGTRRNQKGEIEFTENQLENVNEEYIRSPRELMANAFDLYFTSRDYMKKNAPKTYAFIEKIFDNKDLRFLKSIAPSSSSRFEEIQEDVWIPSKQKPYGNVIEYYENGKKKYIEVSKPIYEAMHQLNPIQVGWLEKIFRIASVPAKVLRFGATATPNFIIRNFIKDQFTAFVQTEKGMKATPLSTLKGLCEIVGHGDLYNQWQKSGGSGSGYYDWSEEGSKKFLKELNNKDGRFIKALKYVGTLQFIQKPSQAAEEATRLGAFMKAKQAGLSDIEAGIASREATVDFARGGDVSKLVNRLVPFFNVGMQSANKLYRTATSNPKAFLFNSLATIAFPSIVISGYYLYAAPEEERKRWLEIPDYVRDNNWCLIIPDMAEPVLIPKPFTVGYFGTVIEDFMIWGYGGDKPASREWWELMIGAAGSLSPIQTVGSLLTPVGQTAIEAMTNYNFFQGRSIYPSWMEKLPPEERSLKTNSQLGLAIGKQLNVSPAVVDNTIFGITSTLGRQIIKGGESMLDEFRRWNGEKVPENIRILKDVPLVGAVIGRAPDGTRSRSYQEFAENYNRLSQIKAAYSSKSGKEKADYRVEHSQDLSDFNKLDNYKDQIRRLQKQINRLYDDPHMSSEKKTSEILALERQITEISFNANRSIEK